MTLFSVSCKRDPGTLGKCQVFQGTLCQGSRRPGAEKTHRGHQWSTWPLRLWLIKSADEEKSELEVAQNLESDALQIRVSHCKMDRERGVDSSALSSSGPEEGGLGIK